jgi:hypothetical protein
MNLSVGQRHKYSELKQTKVEKLLQVILSSYTVYCMYTNGYAPHFYALKVKVSGDFRPSFFHSFIPSRHLIPLAP